MTVNSHTFLFALSDTARAIAGNVTKVPYGKMIRPRLKICLFARLRPIIFEVGR